MTTNQNNHINREFLLNLEVQVESLRDIEYDKPKHIIRTCQDELFGLEIDNKEILPPIYSSINFFDSGFDGTTVWLIVEKDNKFGLIECTQYSSDFCLEIIYDSIIKSPYDLSYGEWGSFRVEPRCGEFIGIYDLIAKRMIIPCQYNKIDRTIYGYQVELNGLKGAYFFKERGGSYSSIWDYSIPCLYDNIEIFSSGIISTMIVTKNGFKGICLSEKEIIPPKYDRIEHYEDELFGLFKDGKLLYKVFVDGKIGLHDYIEEIIPPKYDRIKSLCSDIYKIYIKDKVGLYRNKKEIVPPIYDEITCEYRGNIIRSGEFYGLVTENNKIIEPLYDDIKTISPFYAFCQSGKWGVLDENSNVIFKTQFQDVDSIDIVDDKDRSLFKVKIDEYWGVINWEEKFIVPAIYDYISTDEGIIYTRKGRNKYKIDKDEEFVGKIGYDQSCGYINNPTIFAYDKNLNDLLAAPTE